MSRAMTAMLAKTAAAVGLAALVAGCERPPVDSVQHGFRGTGMVQVYNPRTVAGQIPKNVVPESLPEVPAEGPKAGEIYQNVKVLGHLSAAQFTRLMVAMTQWVSPEQGCNYCHNPQNLADDSLYTKVVARRMIEMTVNVNSKWKSHVADTGVTCYTCHRGQPVPANIWFAVPPQNMRGNFIGDRAEQNIAGEQVGLTSLPTDPFSHYFKGAAPIRVIGNDAPPGADRTGNRSSIKQAEFTYGLMMHMSEGLGVNCTYCHNTRSMAGWDGPPQRATAYYGIRMVREMNVDYMEPLTKAFPANRLGPTGDVAKANCATCHQGAYKPLYGTSMLKAHQELAAPPPPAAPPVAVAEARAEPTKAAPARPAPARAAAKK